MTKGKWKLEGWDEFEGAPYSLPGAFDTEEEAREAARKRLAYLEKNQPSRLSGGQGPFGIQDQVYIIRPDGTKYRFC